MRILALDQSSHCNGWAVFENGELIEYGKFVIKNKDLGERLYDYRQKLIELLDKYKVDKVAFEDIQLQEQSDNYTLSKGVVTYKILAEIFGVTEELMYELNIPYTVVSSNTWKSKLNIKGKKRSEQKQNCQKWVYDTYQIKCTQDEADSIAIGASIFIEDKKLTYHSW